MKKFLTRRAVAATLFVALVNAPAWAADTAVKISNFTFDPPQMTVKAGTTVTSTTLAFKSAALDTEDKFSFTFTTPGTYKYFCALHPHMTGTIVVETATGDNTPK